MLLMLSVLLKLLALVTLLSVSLLSRCILNSIMSDKPLKPGSYKGRKNTAPEKNQSINGENHA